VRCDLSMVFTNIGLVTINSWLTHICTGTAIFWSFTGIYLDQLSCKTALCLKSQRILNIY